MPIAVPFFCPGGRRQRVAGAARLVIESALGNMFAYTARQKGDVGRTLPGHKRILVAIRGRRPNAARLAVRRLLGSTRRIVGPVIQAGATRAKAA